MKPDHEKAVRSLVNSWDVFDSLTTDSGKFECWNLWGRQPCNEMSQHSNIVCLSSSTLHTRLYITIFLQCYITIFATTGKVNTIGRSPDCFFPMWRNSLGTKLERDHKVISYNSSNLMGLGREGTKWEIAAQSPASASAVIASLCHIHCDTCIYYGKH